MDEKRNQSGNRSEEKDLEKMVEQQSRGEQPQGVQTEEQGTAEGKELDSRENKGKGIPP